MEELPVEHPAHMATAERQLHDWEEYITGKKLTNETSGEDVWPPNTAPGTGIFPPLSLDFVGREADTFGQMISKEQLPKGTKVIREREEIDLDYTPDRITVVLGDDDIIEHVYRG